jgi:cold shock CspA family protein
MRAHGTLTKWNDDRGFGFITPAKGAADLFVHISAFPRDGVRPRLNELISFETETGRDGKPRAIRVMRAAQRAAAPPVPRARPQPAMGRMVRAMLMLVVVVGVATYAITHLTTRPAPVAPPIAALPASAPAPDAPVPERVPATFTAPPSAYSCDGRTSCGQMRSCAEATYFIRNCPNTQMDGDNDGIPCESQWCQ